MNKLKSQSAVGSSEMVSQPRRIQLSRKRGWRMPPNTVVVARPRRWGNPFCVDHANGIDAETAVLLFERANNHPHTHKRIREELRGRNLACWCPLDQPCHADVLLRLANAAMSDGADK